MKKTLWALALVLTATVLTLPFSAEQATEQTAETAEKINGVSFVAPVHPIDAGEMVPIKKVHANWVAITPYAFGLAGSPELRFNISGQWWGERDEGVARTIEYARQLDLRVMLKPHVWVHGHGWAGEFTLETEEQWQKWESAYRDYILSNARLADSLNVEILCVGTEFRLAAVERPEFWKKLIREVRGIYKGKLTYAANWDNYENITFWKGLDYIGVDSYFDLSAQKEPDVAYLKKQWQPVKANLRTFSEQQDKPILFTEFGYRSVDYTAAGHWRYTPEERKLNLQAQAKAYQALFETFWNEEWFAGGFLWKWFDRHAERGGPKNDQYTPQNKPAEETIRAWYGR